MESMHYHRPASVADARSWGEMKGCWRTQALRVGQASSMISAAVAGHAIHSGTRASRNPSAHAIPSAASAGSADPKVRMQAGGKHPDQFANGSPTRV